MTVAYLDEIHVLCEKISIEKERLPEFTLNRYITLYGIEQALLAGKCWKDIKETYKLGRSAYYDWRKRLKDNGLLRLVPESRAPQKGREKQWNAQDMCRLLELRLQHPTTGARELHSLLRELYDDVKTKLGTWERMLSHFLARGMVQTVRKALKRGEKTGERCFAAGHAKRRPKGRKSEYAGDMVQIDHTRFIINKREYKVFVGICPRTKLISVRAYTRATSEAAAKFLKYMLKQFKQVGIKIESTQVDGGSEFRGSFENACQGEGIKLYVLHPNRPQDNGCVERCNRTLKEQSIMPYNHVKTVYELNEVFESYVTYYSTRRPHRSLGMMPPLVAYLLTQGS